MVSLSKCFFLSKMVWNLYTWGYGDLIYEYKSKQNDHDNNGLLEDIFRYF